jgi:hypothetical protein
MNHDCGGAQSCCGSGKVLPFWVVSGFCRTRASGATGATHEGFFMKYTIEGFNQEMMVDLGLDGNDAIILRWFSDFIPAMKKRTFGTEHEYGWVGYQHLIDDLPLLGIKSADSIGRRFARYVSVGLMQTAVEKMAAGSRAYFRQTEKWSELVTHPSQKSGATRDSERVPPVENVVSYPNPNDPSSNDPKEGAPNQKETVSTRPVSDLFSALFSERCEGAKSSFSARFVGPTQNLIRTHGLEAVLINVHGYFEVDWWFTKERSNGGHTWSYSGWLNHFDEIQSGISMSIKRSESSKKNAEIAGRLIGRTG